MHTEMSRETVNSMIKSCIVSRKGGVPLSEIENDYKGLVGQSIPYAALGYKNLQDFINSIDFVKIKKNYLGVSVLFVSDPKIAHIESLVSKQKDSTNRYPHFQKNGNNRWASDRRGKRFSKENNNIPRQRNENQRGTNNNYRPDKFKNNTRLEYTRSKWYSNRTQDSWTRKKNENRETNRFNNFNAGRTSVYNDGNNSNLRNVDRRSGSSASTKSTDEDTYNFNSHDERRYAQETRSWKTRDSTTDRSPWRSYNSEQSNYFAPCQLCGGPTNNSNNWWRDWGTNYKEHWAPLDNQSGRWWPGLQRPASRQFPWMGMQRPETYPGYYPWENKNPPQFPAY